MQDESGYELPAFAETFLIQCPRCKNCASVFTPENALGVDEAIIVFGHESKRVACTKCGFTKEIHPKRRSNCYEYNFNPFGKNQGTDWYFDFPLFLQIPCCGHQLWFLNDKHLTYVEAYLKKNIRPSNTYYMSIESRLPKWIKSSKNRSEILKAIAKLKKKI